jgi:hypothetical protein
MTAVPWHHGTQYAGQTLEWMPTDTHENFLRLQQEQQHRDYFASLGWDRPGAITYKINSHGFRADEFDSGPYLLALGCSYTIGIGLPVESTWPYLTAQALSLKCANLAWGGYSSDTCFRLAEYWIPELQPTLVVMLAPPRHRVELMLGTTAEIRQRFEVVLPLSQSKILPVSNDSYLKHWFLEDENARLNQLKNCLAVQQLSASLQIPCYIYLADHYMSQSREEIGYARDFMHGGPKVHKNLADKIIHDYQKPS